MENLFLKVRFVFVVFGVLAEEDVAELVGALLYGRRKGNGFSCIGVLIFKGNLLYGPAIVPARKND